MERARTDAPRAFCRIVVLSLLSSTVGCTELSPDAKQLLLTAEQHYAKAQYREATERANRFLAAYSDRPEAAEALYVRGLARLKHKQRDAARSDFRNALSRSQRDDLTAHLRAQLGVLASDDGQWAAAVRHFEQAVDALPEKPPTDEILYRYGRALQRLSRWDDARIQFAKIMHFYRSGTVVQQARRHFSWRERHFAIQCAAFRERGRADREATILRDDGLPSYARLDTRDDNPLWKVYVGQYATYDDAVRSLPNVKRIRDEAFIVP